MERNADVIVVGAGFTGLAAAQALVDRGLSVIVLEARAEVGGRVRSFETSDGTRRDAGGQFVCDDMPEVMALVRAARLELGEVERVDSAGLALLAELAARARTQGHPLSISGTPAGFNELSAAYRLSPDLDFNAPSAAS